MAASYGPDDKGHVRRSAEMHADMFLDLSREGDVEAARGIANARPHIFVDLMAHTTGAR